MKEERRVGNRAGVCFAVLLAGCHNAGEMSRIEEFRLRSECAAQAEKVAGEPRFRQSPKSPGITTSESHYNRQLNKCFVLVHYALDTMADDMLLDAYEDTVLIECVEDAGKRACNAKDVQLKLEEVDRRIKDYMEQ